jgi:hypothetical protein
VLTATRAEVGGSFTLLHNATDLLLGELLTLPLGLLSLDSSLTQRLVPFPGGRSAGVFNLGDVLELVEDGFDDCAFAQ